VFTANVDALTFVPGSELANLFTDPLKSVQDTEGRIYIDLESTVYEDVVAYLASGRTEYDPKTDPTTFNNALTDLGLTKGLSYPDIFTVDNKYVNDPEKSMQSIFDTPPDILECKYHESFDNTGLGAFEIAWWSHQLSESWKIRAGFDWFELTQFYAK
jgi:hypothetical protein